MHRRCVCKNPLDRRCVGEAPVTDASAVTSDRSSSMHFRRSAGRPLLLRSRRAAASAAARASRARPRRCPSKPRSRSSRSRRQ
eukprot:2803428-Pyramimonas_sp.AAC.1